MRILWLSGNPALYAERTKGYNSGGWIGALEAEITKNSEIELGISFFFKDDCFKQVIGNTTYYPINHYTTKAEKIKHNLFYEKYDDLELQAVLSVIKDFKPDVIHVWGTEISFGLITKYTTIPVVIHLQGILNAVHNAIFIPGISKEGYISNNGTGLFKRLFNIQALRFWKHNSDRELEIFKNCKYFIGRTNWDQQISQLLAPNSTYYYCSELLREPFYKATAWNQKDRRELIITSVLSSPSYKGIDLILKCANILKAHINIHFEWNIFGVKDCQFAEKLTGIKSKNVNVNLKGIVNAETLVAELLQTDLFVHPSYIDNSPNSICEAQILGIPVISTNVGGISSLIEDGETGFLVPANDPFILASRIIEIKNNPEKAIKISENGRVIAYERHHKVTIKNNLLNIYKKLKYAKDIHKSI